VSQGEGDRSGHSDLVSAYREGLGVAFIAVIRDSDGICVVAAQGDGESALPAGEAAQMRWWCRRAADAERVAAAVKARLRRSASPDGNLVRQFVEYAARRLNVELQSDDEILDEAFIVIERINCELEQLRNAGGLRSVNKSYRTYRVEAAARGEGVVPYARWMAGYKQSLVRKAAATLRYL
jgi:hypothetical protein